MKHGKVRTSARRHQPSVSKRDATIDSRPLTRPEQPYTSDQPFVVRPVPLVDDAFSCPPQIYDPAANFIVDSALSDLGSEYQALIGPSEGSDTKPEDVDPTAAQLEALEKSRQAVYARFNARIKQIDEQIARLQAIAHPPPEGEPHD
jgi:hypothetical protein